MKNFQSAQFSSMHTEFATSTIMSRLDGSSLAASACASAHLRDAVSDQNLWKNLCIATWPSTQGLVSSMALNQGFNKFYADAFPLILGQSKVGTPTVASSSDLASFVDIYYKGKCIVSRVLNAIPEPFNLNDDSNTKNSDELLQWLLDSPFRLDLLPYSVDDNDSAFTLDNDSIKYFARHNLQNELSDDMRLSWILFDKKNEKAVNLSSWKPMFVKKSWAPDGEYMLHFGSIVKLDTSIFAECKIEVRFQVIQNNGNVKWTDISIRIEDIAGAHLGLTKSLIVFNQALNSKRTTKHLEVEKANNKYKMHQKEIKRRDDSYKHLFIKLYALVGLIVLTTISYGST